MISKKNRMVIRNKQLIVFLSAVMAFTANMPILKVGPFSLSFFFGAMLIAFILLTNPHMITIHKDLKGLFMLVFFSIFSLVLSPLDMSGSTVFVLIQIVYWFLLACIFSNIYEVSGTTSYLKSVILVLFIILFVFSVSPGEDGPLSQNESSFIAVTIWPLGLKFFDRWKKVPYIAMSLVLVYLIGSRTGLLIFMLQLFALYAIARISSKTIMRLLILMGLGFALISNISIRGYIAEKLFPESYDMQLLIQEPSIAFQMDKSWVQRRIQQEKCKQVFAKHPLIGVGPLNVEHYNININTSKMNDVDDAILRLELKDSTNRSAHNSYYQMLAENGFIGVTIVVFLLGGIIVRLYKNRYLSDMNIYIIISAIGLYINLYMVSAFWGTNTWMLLGLYLGYGKQAQISKNRTLQTV